MRLNHALSFLLLFHFLALTSVAFAQITGSVHNIYSNEPIVGAGVYVANTSYGTFTDIDGNFTLAEYPAKPFALNISAIGFHTKSLTIEKDSTKEYHIKLNEKTEEIEAVTVYGESEDLWDKYGLFFTELFVGYSKIAQNCEIVNKKDILFYYNQEQKSLHVSAQKPLVIKNKDLGYKITYWLDHFVYNYEDGYLFYQGFPFFEPLQKNKTKKKVIENRETAHNGSLLHFIRAAYKNEVNKDGFAVHRMQKRRISELYQSNEKTVDTLPHNQIGLTQKLDSLLRANDNLTQWRTQKILQWAHEATNEEYYRQVLYRKVNNGETKSIVEFQKKSFGIIATSFLFNPTIERRGRNGVYEKIVQQDLTSKDFVIDKEGSKHLFFKDYLLIIYQNELEEQEYQRNQRYREAKQTSLLTLTNRKSVKIQQDGSISNPENVMSEGYWSYEKMDKTLPLDYALDQ